MRVTDEIPDNVTGFRFTIDTSGRKWDAVSMQSADRGVRVHTINSTSTDDNGVAVYNVYVMGDNMTDVLYVDIVAEAVDAGADIIMLDNMTNDMMRDAVTLVGGKALTEASGGITHETIADIARTGVDIISVGAITHSVTAFDISLKIQK